MVDREGEKRAGRALQGARMAFALADPRRVIWRGPILWLIVCGSVLIAALMIGTAVMVLNFRAGLLDFCPRGPARSSLNVLRRRTLGTSG